MAGKDLSKLAKKLAFNYSKLSESFFWVDGRKFAHHITLFDILVSQKSIKSAEEVVAKNLRKMSSIELLAKGVWKSRNGYLGLKVKNSKELLSLKRRLFKELSGFNSQEVGTKYNAHITLTRYKDPNFPYSMKIVSPITKSFNFENIIFARVDKHGQVYKILKTFKLKS